MSIKALARDLYKAQQNVDRLEKALENAKPPELAALEVELRQAKAELQMIRRMMEGEKESSSFRKKFDGFTLKR